MATWVILKKVLSIANIVDTNIEEIFMTFKELLVKNKTRVDIILKKLIKNYPESESFYKANIISLINKLCSMEEKAVTASCHKK